MAEHPALFDITFIGAGPTGLFGACYSGLRGLKTKLIDALPEIGGQLTALYPEKYIYDTPGHPKILAKDLVKLLHEQCELFKPVICLDEQVLSFERYGEEFLLKSKLGEHRTKVIIICAGVGAFAPNKLDLPGVKELEGKSIFYSVKEKAFFRGKKVLIVGGGDSAVDWALNLRDTASEITLIHRREGFRAHEGSLKELFSSPQIEVLCHFELKELIQEKGILKKTIIFDNRDQSLREIAADAILFFLGYKADLGPIKDWGLTLKGRQLEVNGAMETNLPGIFAAGDIAHDPQSVHLNLICMGYAQAAVAVNRAAQYINPKAALYPGHSSEMKL